MKKAFLLVVIALAVACKKDKSTTANNVYGKWELRETMGNLPVSAKSSAGNGDIYQFNANGTYVRFLNNKQTASGHYHISITETRDTLKFGNIELTSPTYNDAWRQTPHTIAIGSSAADGPTYIYRRIN